MLIFLRRFFILSFAFASGLAHADTMTVAVAANMQYAFEALSADFTRHTGMKVQAVYGASGKLTAQIQHGAPYAILISADTDYPQALYSAGLAAERPRVYAFGKLVLWTTRNLILDARLQILGQPEVKRIALPNPKLAPYGREAIHAMERAGLMPALASKLVYGESIAQAAQYIGTGTVDLGFTALSVVRAPAMQEKGRWVEVDPALYMPIAQSLVLLKSGLHNHPRAAPQLLAYLFSPAARAILERYGYALP